MIRPLASASNALRCRRGNFATSLAILAPIFAGLIGGALDFVAYNNQRSALQSAVDGAALAAVNEAGLKGWNTSVASSVADVYVAANIAQTIGGGDYYKIDTSVDVGNRQITVAVRQDHYPFFYSSMFPSPQIAVSATATASGSTNICVIGLHQSDPATVSLEDRAKMTAPDCAIYSNSSAPKGLSAVDFSTVAAQLACSAGGYDGFDYNFSGDPPLTDCPALHDPLASRPAPGMAGYCDHTDLSINEGSGGVVMLDPGTYCGGITIRNNATVELRPGVYVIKGGSLSLAANAEMFGKHVGFYFADDASFSLESGSIVDLTAPRTGPLAGLLFYQAPGSAERDFVLRSNKASVLLGTIYLPNGNFIIDTNSKVADQSAYTVIVARSLALRRQPDVVLNTNYGATDVPVPVGVGPQKGAPRLIR